ncbi:Biopolymer transport protein ExbD/TolR [Pirellula staleyi DSM 6068]|uniref:Biopolymer transport protein ExbD/TolR n=1 Tax=Pirellula staleyi (strain ATCC 27377 / DSM 6068 / ICPB 4128) TaxID=530564 RepID=D2R3Y8_PIRSD|nr:biopolymer transporter ExbD [Pirellula staleyi]ADB18837.1 Biopolymer transport protein ExbD/TolR [Pirellula staleyi DSM 6068]
MPIKRESQLGDKIPIDMTPMIDIVFQLLTFFIMTLKIASVEGDFNIKMPLAAPRAGQPDPDVIPPIKVRLRATSSGDLADVLVNDTTYGTGDEAWQRVQVQVAGLAQDGSLSSSIEVELDCDYGLKYENVIAAITAVSGKLGPDGRIIKLAEKIKFAPPRPQ